MSKGVRVLITGFGPFPGAPYNPSMSLVKRLAQLIAAWRERRAIATGFGILLQLLTCPTLPGRLRRRRLWAGITAANIARASARLKRTPSAEVSIRDIRSLANGAIAKTA